MGWLSQLIVLLLHDFHLVELSGAHSLRVTTRVSSLLPTARHFLNLSLVLQMVLVVLVEASLSDNSLFVKQAFCKGMVFTLDPFGFLLANDKI